jgi:hypothetical protein
VKKQLVITVKADKVEEECDAAIADGWYVTIISFNTNNSTAVIVTEQEVTDDKQ